MGCDDVILTRKKQVLGAIEKVCGTAETLTADNGKARITVGSAAEYDAPREDRDIARSTLTPLGTLESTKAVNVNFESELNTPDTPLTKTGLDVDQIDWQSGNIIRYTFSASDLSTVKVGSYLRAYECTNTSNDGSFYIVAVNDTNDTVDVINRSRDDNTDDEAAGSPGRCDIARSLDYSQYFEGCACDVNVALKIAIGAITSGPFVRNEVITGGTSGATGRVLVEATNGDAFIYYELTSATDFDNAEVVTGGTSGATATTSNEGKGAGLRVTPTSTNFEVLTTRLEEDGFQWTQRSAMGNFTINWQSNRKGMIAFNMSGPRETIGDQALTASVVQDTEQPPILKNADLELDAFNPVFQSAVFDIANKIVLRENGNAAGDSGFESARITGRRPTLTITLELDLAANYDFYTKYDAGTDVEIKFQTGSVAEKNGLVFCRRSGNCRYTIIRKRRDPYS